MDKNMNPTHVPDYYIENLIKTKLYDFDQDIKDLIKNNKKVPIGKILKDQEFDDKVQILYLSVILDNLEMTKYISKKIGLLSKNPPEDFPIKYDYRMAGRGIYSNEWNHEIILFIIYLSELYGTSEIKKFAKELYDKHMHVMGYDNYDRKQRKLEKIIKFANINN